MHTLKAETYVNRDSTKVVKAGSPESAFLLGMKGDEISEETAKRLGLLAGAAPVDDAPSSKYAEMTVPELRAAAEEAGLDLPAKALKADLVSALEESDAAAAEASGTAQAESPAEA